MVDRRGSLAHICVVHECKATGHHCCPRQRQKALEPETPGNHHSKKDRTDCHPDRHPQRDSRRRAEDMRGIPETGANPMLGAHQGIKHRAKSGPRDTKAKKADDGHPVDNTVKAGFGIVGDPTCHPSLQDEEDWKRLEITWQFARTIYSDTFYLLWVSKVLNRSALVGLWATLKNRPGLLLTFAGNPKFEMCRNLFNLAEFLVKNGVDVNVWVRGPHHTNPCMVHVVVVAWSLQRRGQKLIPLPLNIPHHSVMFSLLMEGGANMQAKQMDGATPLHIACQKRDQPFCSPEEEMQCKIC